MRIRKHSIVITRNEMLRKEKPPSFNEGEWSENIQVIKSNSIGYFFYFEPPHSLASNNMNNKNAKARPNTYSWLPTAHKF